jgi:UDP-N-acetylmuramate: L-alanyl-gamma-D-glutamyl-meso-diaminopimelate ligase
MEPEARRLVVVYEPRTYTSRTRSFQRDFAAALAEADLVVVAGAFRPDKVPQERRLSERDLVGEVAKAGTRALFVAGVDEIVARLSDELQAGDCVAVLSSGGFGGLHGKLRAVLEPHTAKEA